MQHKEWGRGHLRWHCTTAVMAKFTSNPGCQSKDVTICKFMWLDMNPRVIAQAMCFKWIDPKTNHQKRNQEYCGWSSMTTANHNKHHSIRVASNVSKDICSLNYVIAYRHKFEITNHQLRVMPSWVRWKQQCWRTCIITIKSDDEQIESVSAKANDCDEDDLAKVELELAV